MREYTTIKLPNELIADLDKLIGKHGFRSRGEIVKEALRDFLKQYADDIESELCEAAEAYRKLEAKKEVEKA
ncbi:MAG: ribbon-helix-helix domain-containing protein [Candidatus Bathyarchaeia archaeon]